MSFFLMCVFQWFLISLSVRPGNFAAILDHLQKDESPSVFRSVESKSKFCLQIREISDVT
jgi:hypothetical protein